MNKLYKRLLAIIAILIMSKGILLASGTKDDYLNSYLTIESLTDNDTIELGIPAELTSEELVWLAYSTDATNWTTMEVNGTTQNETIILNQGEKVYLKGLGKQCSIVLNNTWHRIQLHGSSDHVVYGNIMSLLYGDAFASQTAFPEGSTYSFACLFHTDSHLVSAENLMLPASSLASGCYYALFAYCSSLSSPTPALPAAVLEYRCYMFMYYGCTSLTEASALPATTLANQCYYRMFEECSSLETAPALPATTMFTECYLAMFYGCSSLTMAPELPATTLAELCYYRMFEGCSSLETAPALPATTLARGCYFSLFGGCSSLTTVPDLPATTLADYCYGGMFVNCTSLEAAPALPATTLALACYEYMFGHCYSLAEAPALPATTLADLCYTSMFFECTSLASAPELPATTLAPECYSFMFCQCASLAEAPELPATTMELKCYKGMFDGCTSLTRTPILTAPVLAEESYTGMFRNCTQLQEVICLAIDISATDCVDCWLENVAPTGCFYMAPEMGDWPIDSDSGIPVGWLFDDYDAVNDQQVQVFAYPNPVVDKLHITGTDIQSVKVFDIQGRLVHSEECGHADQVEVDFQGFSKGIYTVSILSEGKVVNQQVVFIEC